MITILDDYYFRFRKTGSVNIRINTLDGSGLSSILHVEGSPEHSHRPKPDREVTAATDSEDGVYPEAHCLICGEMIQTERTISRGKVLCLPNSLELIEDEAFCGLPDVQQINIPSGVTTIGSKAFAGDSGLLVVLVPDSVKSISVDAFGGDINVIILCNKGSYAEQYAKKHGIPCSY